VFSGEQPPAPHRSAVIDVTPTEPLPETMGTRNPFIAVEIQE
jgi:phosphoglycerate dehydrogenase-like enzyme